MSRSRSILRSPARRRASKQGVALLALLAPFAFGSCVADSVSLRITCNIAPEADCRYQSAGDCKAYGFLNLSVWINYFATLRVANGLKPRNSDVPPQSEPNGIQIYELEVEVSNSAGKKLSFGNGVPNPYTVPASGFIEPSEDGLVSANLIPASYVRRLIDMANGRTTPNQVRLDVIARGKTSGGVSVESASWNWAVDLLNVSLNEPDNLCAISDDNVCEFGQDQSSATCSPATVPE